jgi:hypothetical protein
MVKRKFNACHYIINHSRFFKAYRETHHWIRLPTDSEYLDKELSKDLIIDLDEILRIIGSIQKAKCEQLKQM